MAKTIRNFVKPLSFVMFFLLVACSKINSANFEQIKPGMTMAQVVKILGEPTSVESVNIAGISGTSASWKNHDATVVIQFFNDQVGIKTFSKTGQNNSQQDMEINLPTGADSDNQ